MNITDFDATHLCKLSAAAGKLGIQITVSENMNTSPALILVVGTNEFGMTGQLASELSLRTAVKVAAERLGVSL